jgi:cellulose synthase/poly-beta-1,6-N-acetylglucosamine synthase-like glycosyltransferase
VPALLHAVIAVSHVAWWRQLHHMIPVGLVGAVSWTVWLTRFSLSRRYRPVPAGYRATTSVVVPAYREDPDIVERCLRTWLAENPTEIIVVPDLADTAVIGRLHAYARVDPRIRVVPFAHRGKRSALGAGIHRARGEILVLCDSDTSWMPGLLAAVIAPFQDPRVGGVGTRQNAYLATSSIWRRIADWMIDIRYLDYVRAQSRAGAVACLSGRTAAYRRAAVMPVLEHLEDEFFLGRRCVAGDDGRLTWLILASGYRTVYQSTARAMSMFPDSGRAFFKQRIRWSRNSYRTYFTAMWNGWLWRQPLICQVSVLQVMLTPVTMGFAVTYLFAWVLHPSRLVALAAVGWLLAGRAIRGFSHLRERPSDIWVLPVVAILTIVIALPVKTYALLTMNVQGWLTRHENQLGGEGQTAASLTRPPRQARLDPSRTPVAPRSTDVPEFPPSPAVRQFQPGAAHGAGLHPLVRGAGHAAQHPAGAAYPAEPYPAQDQPWGHADTGTAAPARGPGAGRRPGY